jgi:hypothetical protein
VSPLPPYRAGALASALLAVVACSSSNSNYDFCGTLLSKCQTGSRTTCDGVLAQDATDHPSCVSARNALLNCITAQSSTWQCQPDNTLDVGADSSSGEAVSIEGYTAYVGPACASLVPAYSGCVNGTLCTPPTDVGAEQTFVLTPASPSASANAAIVAPGNGNHVWTTKFDVDVSAFSNGGTLTVSGTLGSPGCDGSFDLFSGCATLPASGALSDLGSADNTGAGKSWKFTYTFQATNLFHFGAEGNWNSAQGTTNQTSVVFQVGP